MPDWASAVAPLNLCDLWKKTEDLTGTLTHINGNGWTPPQRLTVWPIGCSSWWEGPTTSCLPLQVLWEWKARGAEVEREGRIATMHRDHLTKPQSEQTKSAGTVAPCGMAQVSCKASLGVSKCEFAPFLLPLQFVRILLQHLLCVWGWIQVNYHLKDLSLLT